MATKRICCSLIDLFSKGMYLCKQSHFVLIYWICINILNSGPFGKFVHLSPRYLKSSARGWKNLKDILTVKQWAVLPQPLEKYTFSFWYGWNIPALDTDKRYIVFTKCLCPFIEVSLATAYLYFMQSDQNIL